MAAPHPMLDCSVSCESIVSRINRFKVPVMDFDQFMGNVKATGAVPYLVLNYDSCNLIYGSGDWSYSQLLALAQSWVAYIIRMGYAVSSACELSPAAHSTPDCRPSCQFPRTIARRFCVKACSPTLGVKMTPALSGLGP